MPINVKEIPVLVCLALITAGCDTSFTPNLTTPETKEDWLAAAGTPRFVYMDAGYKAVASTTTPDPGKTLVFIEQNALAGGTVVIAETSDGEVDDTVRIVNTSNNTVISMFYHKGQNLPWGFELYDGAGKIEALVHSYDHVWKKFKVTFLDQERKTFENLPLNIGAHIIDAALDTQKTRLKNIYTALGIYESVSRHAPRNNNYGALFSLFFYDRSVISFAATANGADGITGADSIASPEGRFWLFDAIVSIFTGGSSSSSSSPSSPAAPPPLSVTITKDGKKIDPQTIYYLGKGEEEIVFEFAFNDNFTNNLNIYAGWYEPRLKEYCNSQTLNACFFILSQEDGSPLGSFTKNHTVKIKRMTLEGTGIYEGKIDLVVFFGQNTIVNGGGVYFLEPGTDKAVLNNSIFVIHLCHREGEEK